MTEPERDSEAMQMLGSAIELFEIIKTTNPQKATEIAHKLLVVTIQDVHKRLVDGFMNEDLTVDDAAAAMADSAGKLMALATMLGIELTLPKRDGQ